MIAAVLAALITMLLLLGLIYGLTLLLQQRHQGQEAQRQIEARMGCFMAWTCLWCHCETNEPFYWPPLCEACRILYDVQRRKGA